MALLVLLLPDQAAIDAAKTRALLDAEPATFVSFQRFQPKPDGWLDSALLANYANQGGVDLGLVATEFDMRDVVLVETPTGGSKFTLMHLWSSPDAPYDIDAVRIPHEGKTDPRNNPLGKNPGNIWSFRAALHDGKAGRQSRLGGEQQVSEIVAGVPQPAIERLVRCHTREGDRVFHNCSSKTLAEVVERLGRIPCALPHGEGDPIVERRPVLESPGPVSKTPQSVEGLPRDVQVFLGDSRAANLVIPVHRVSDLVTSPPYNIGYSPFNVAKRNRKTGQLEAPQKATYSDQLPNEQYHGLLREVFASAEKVLSSSADVFVNIKNDYGGGRCVPPFWLLWLVPSAWRLADVLVWRYDISYDPAVGKYKPYYEWVFRFSKGHASLPKRRLADFYLPILKGNSKEREGLVHPAIFPKELVRRCLQESGHKEGAVLDPFLGSGTTVAVAYEENRPGIGFELNPDFVPDIKARLAQATRYIDRPAALSS
jgi:DNA modification methylase